MPTLVSVVAAVAFASLTFFVLRRVSWHTHRSEFPGPKPLPILGNIHQFPNKEAFRKFKEWGKEYGPITQIKIFSQRILIVNSHRVAAELLTDRGQIYAGRPFLPMGSGECDLAKTSIILMEPGPEFRYIRKIFRRVLEGKTLGKFKDHVESVTQKFLARLHSDPGRFITHIRTTGAAVILLISHGYSVDPRPGQDPFVRLAEQAVTETALALEPGRWLVDLIPLLRYIPGWFPFATFKRHARNTKDLLHKLAADPFKWVKSEMKSGRAMQSCARMLLEEQPSPEQEESIMWAMSTLYGAGSDTVISVNTSFFLAMSCHPEVVAQAQEELDLVIGPGRLPVWEDRSSLPYIEAIMTEVLRYAPPAPTALPHKATADDNYQGRPIEKGTIVFPNVWGMIHDEDIFNRPFEFMPERFLEKINGSGRSPWRYVPSTPDPRSVVFGFGRRFCPGRELALMEVWHMIALTLHVFDIKSKTDVVEPLSDSMFVTTTITRARDFECIIRPRSPSAEALLRNIIHHDVSLDFMK